MRSSDPRYGGSFPIEYRHPDIPVNEQTRNEIIHRSLRGQSQREIAKRLHVSRNTIKSVLDELQSTREGRTIRADRPSSTKKRATKKRASRLDRYETTLKELLVRYPDMPVVQVQQRLQKVGCDASYTILRQRVKRIRQSVSRGELSPATAPGAVARVVYRDVEIELSGESQSGTHLFLLQLAYSRRVYLHFVPRTDLATTIHEHICAFEHFSGAAASVEYDGVPVVEECHSDAKPTFNSIFLRFASHYGFRPVSCRESASDNEPLLKQIQREILHGNRYRSLDHANDSLFCWFSSASCELPCFRPPTTDRQQQETAHLIPLPTNPWRG